MKKFFSTTSLFITILVLLAIMVGLQQFNYESTSGVFNPKSLAATGFIILSAFTMGEFFRAIKIPALLGYIAAGILFGPNLAPIISPQLPTLFSMQVIDNLALINVLTVGVIGTMGGGELKIEDIKGNVKTIFLVIAMLFLLAFPATTGAIILMSKYTPSIVPFLKGQSPESVIAAALLMGVFSIAMSPAAALAIFQETKAKGKFTSLVLGIVVVADIALVLAFLLTFSFDKILLAPEGFRAEALFEALPKIGLEFGYALLIGIVTGIIYILYMRFVARELMFFTVAVIFAASYASTLLHAETLMAFLIAGFIVQNFSKHGHDMIHSLEKISLPVFVIYFMTQAAQLDLLAVFGFLGITAILTVIRGAAFYSGTKLATRWSGAKENVQNYLWLCFFSRGGVDLVLGAAVAAAIPQWGQDFQTVIMAVVVVHIVAGPPLLKLGLDWAGETESARTASTPGLSDSTAIPGTISQEDLSFPMPKFGDRHLQPHMLELRNFLIDLHRTHIARRFEARSSILRKYINRLETSSEHACKSILSILENDDYESTSVGNAERAKEVRKIRTRYHQAISGLIKEIYTTKTTVVDDFAVSDILTQIRQKESFSSSYRIPNEGYYFDTHSSDSSWARLLKSLRRLGRMITGSSGCRQVPFGRLWRFYVELEVPRALGDAARESSERNQALWREFGEHIRRIDLLFTDISRLLNEEVELRVLDIYQGDSTDEPATRELETSVEEALSEEEKEVTEEVNNPREDAKVALLLHKEEIDRRRKTVLAYVNDWETTSIRYYTLSLKQPYSELLRATYKAGTLELPSFIYRPSVRFDASRTAEKELHETIAAEEGFTEGQKGWIVTEEQNLNFSFWFDIFSTRLSDKLNGTLIVPVQAKLNELERICQQLPPEIIQYNQEVEAYQKALLEAEKKRDALEKRVSSPGAIQAVDPGASVTTETTEPDIEMPTPPVVPVIDWESWYAEHIRPQLDRTRNILEYLRQTFNDASPMSRQGRTLEIRIERFALNLFLLQEDPAVADISSNVFRFSPEEWFVQELETAVKLRLSEVNERARSILQLSLNAIADFEQFATLNLTTPLTQDVVTSDELNEILRTNNNSVSITNRAAKIANELADSQAKRVAELRRWLVSQLHDIYQAAATPILERNVRRLSGSVTPFATKVRRKAPLALLQRIGPKRSHSPFSVSIYARIRSALSQVMQENQEKVTLNDVRSFLRPVTGTIAGHRGTIPDIYRRLFTPGPLNINGFYIARHLSHHDLLTAIDMWRHTSIKSTVLLHADRGFGKASLIRHILAVPSLEKIRKVNVRLREDLTTVDDLVQDLLNAFNEDPNSSTLETTGLRTLDGQQDVLQNQRTSGLSSYHDLESAIRVIKRNTSEPTIVVIENANKIYRRTEKGLHLCSQFLRLMNETKSNVLWIALCNSSAVQWLETAIEFKSYFSHVIELQPFQPNEFKLLIQRRHPISGFSHSIIPKHHTIFDWLIHPISTYEEVSQPLDKFFLELSRLAKGSPLLGLTYWLDSVEIDPRDENNILVHAPRKTEIDLTEPLSLEKQIILATIIQHGSLTARCLSLILQVEPRDLMIELEHLTNLGFIEIVAGTKQECYRLRAYAEALVTPQLRRRNIL